MPFSHYIDPLTMESIRRRIHKKTYHLGVTDSECVASNDYNPETQELIIEFQQRSIYKYFDVSLETYLGLAGATSFGQFFNRYIRNSYAYERIG